MNTPTPYRYPHINMTRSPKDMRLSSVSEPDISEYFYVVFRVDVSHVYRYHHALLVADSQERLLEAIREETRHIAGIGLLKDEDVAPVFIRSMKMIDPDIMAGYQQHGISEEVKAALSKRNDDHFTIFGTTGERKLALFRNDSRDALVAMLNARKTSALDYSCDLTALDIRQAHPVTPEIEAMFEQTAERIRILCNLKREPEQYLH